jgi:hypothetical protein
MPGFWRKCRIAFRCIRFGAWLLLLALIGAFLWFNRIGLPDFLKARVVATLHERGVELEFSRMRLSLVRGLVADNVRAGENRTADSVTLTARMVQFQLNYPALGHGRLQLDGLILRNGCFTLPLSPTNALTLTNLSTELRFGANDTWSLDHFHADFAGTQIAISGEVAHAPEARRWKLFSSGNADRGALVAELKIISSVLEQIHFQGTPQLRLALAGDAQDLHSITARLEVVADGVNTPWFSAQALQAAANLTAPVNAPTNSDVALGYWTNLQPFRLAWSVKLGQLHSGKLDARVIACAGEWAAPTLAVTNLSARIGDGQFNAGATLDVPARRLSFTNYSSFDPGVVAAWLPEKTRAQLAKISWPQPPVLRAEGSLRLPPWTNAPDNWRAIAPSVRLRGELTVSNAVANQATIDHVQTHFSYADQVLTLPDLTMAQGRTRLQLSGEVSAATKNFHCLISGGIDVASVRAFLTASNVAGGFSILTTAEPLVLSLDVNGNLSTLAELTATGHVALTNFSVREHPMDFVASRLVCTNRTLHFIQPELRRAQGQQMARADEMVLDFKTMMLTFTNGLSTLEPVALTQAIGPKIAEWVEPYHFLKPPRAAVNGCLPLRDMNNPGETVGTDLRFDILQGVPFEWLRLHSPSITGTIHWLGPELVLSNLQAEVYGGTGHGGAYFDFRAPHAGADCQFNVTVTNVNLHQFAVDITTPTNRLEGTLAGTLVVTNSDTRTLDSWNGYGDVKLHDGLLWDIPVFGILSPVLNTVSAGLGNSRATEATAHYTITNGVIFSDSLEIRSTMMRLSYTGTVDMQQKVNARVTAHLLRDVWVVGPLVSTVLWPVSKIFECKVTGNLDNPQPSPIFFPKILLAPLHPIRSLEVLFSPATSTNAPATK